LRPLRCLTVLVSHRIFNVYTTGSKSCRSVYQSGVIV
jgi:hypothetical protein